MFDSTWVLLNGHVSSRCGCIREVVIVLADHQCRFCNLDLYWTALIVSCIRHRCFSRCNEALEGYGKEPIDWTIR